MNELLISRLTKIRKKDIRRTYADFYIAFDLHEFYSSAMVHLIMNGRRLPKNRQFMNFLSRCLDIYDEYTRDYSKIDVNKMNQVKFDYELRHHTGSLSPDDLINATTPNQANIRGALRDPQASNKLSCDLYDLFRLDILNIGRPTKETLFRNLSNYQQLETMLMRALAGDGTYTRSIDDISLASGLSIAQLNNFAGACLDPDEYIRVYNGLVNAYEPYNLAKDDRLD